MSAEETIVAHTGVLIVRRQPGNYLTSFDHIDTLCLRLHLWQVYKRRGNEPRTQSLVLEDILEVNGLRCAI